MATINSLITKARNLLAICNGFTGGSAKDITSAVEEVISSASGTDVSDTTATAVDVLTDKAFYLADGTKTTGSLVISSLSPSNVSPATIASGNNYKASSAGYAIKSYSSKSKSPTTTGASFSSGWNYMNSSGYAYSTKPDIGTDVSDTTASANHVISGKIFHTADGTKTTGTLALENIDPTANIYYPVAQNTAYTMLNAGYVIGSVASSAMSPTTVGSPFSQGWNYMQAGGYACVEQQYIAKGTFTTSSSGTTVNCGFQPTYIILSFWSGSNVGYTYVYWNGGSLAATAYFAGSTTGVNTSATKVTTSSIGFTFTASSTFSGKTAYFIACR